LPIYKSCGNLIIYEEKGDKTMLTKNRVLSAIVISIFATTVACGADNNDQAKKDYDLLKEQYSQLKKDQDMLKEQYSQLRKDYAQASEQYQQMQKEYEQMAKEYKQAGSSSPVIFLFLGLFGLIALLLALVILLGVIFIYNLSKNREKDRQAIADILRSELDKRQQQST
jgi:Flp pilus assembly protein TadB